MNDCRVPTALRAGWQVARRRSVLRALPKWAPLAILLSACGGDEEVASCPTEQRYDPASSEVVELWPDPLLTEPAQTASGLRLDPNGDKAAWLGAVNDLIAPSVQQASAAGGFARGGGVLFRFSAPLEGLPASAEESLTSEAVMLLNLDADPPERVPFEIESSSDGLIVMLQPVVVLEPTARHVAIVTTFATSGGGCVSPSPTARALIRGEVPDPRFADVAPVYVASLADAGVPPERVAAMTAFVTHGDQAQVAAAAEHAGGQSLAWATAPVCDDGAFRRCNATFTANDYRHDHVVQPTPNETYVLPVTIGLPSSGGPHPVLVFGHGLGGDRTSVTGVEGIAEELGMVTVAVDALRHGEHPTAAEISATAFLGLDVSDQAPMDTLVLKSNFNQTNLDRVQLLNLLTQHPDIDGDGQDDVDPSRIAYWGISLGGLLGPGLLAMSNRVDLAILSVGGGKLTRFVSDSSEVEALLGLLETLLGGPDEFAALMVVTQSLVDGGDPMAWAAHVSRDRLLGGSGPHLLLPLAMSDRVVPPSTGKALARAFLAPQVTPVVEPVAPLGTVDAPLTGNVDGRTVGYFQFDRFGDPPEPAGHNLPSSPEAMLQARHFLETWLAGSPEIIDPYPASGTPPLSP